ncbi:MAG: FecR domain-containing protein, partial [Bacteroidota bacterium]
MNQADQHTELIAKYLAGEIQPGERQFLFDWVQAQPENQQFFDEMVQVWSLTADAGAPGFEVNLEQAWQKVEAGIAEQPLGIGQVNGGAKIVSLPERRVANNYRLFFRIAAVFAVLALGIWWFSKQAPAPQLVEVQTQTNQKQEITLPDGSRVWLNENTKIAYNPTFEKRRVSLEGEAFFDVEKMAGKPFEITSGEATTTVLGTSFNVRAYPAEDKIEVTVREGKVKLAVTKQPEKTVLLEEGESGFFDKKEKAVVEVDEKIANADAWKTQRLDFNDDLLKDVFLTLERYFDVKIEAANPAILECHYSSPFEQPKLETILNVISTTLNLEVTQEGSVYKFSG